MRWQQIRNLQTIYDRHVIRKTLFKKHNSFCLSVVANAITLLAVLFFIFLFFFILYRIFASYNAFYDALVICCELSISNCFLLAVGKEIDFLFKQNDVLLPLPIKKTENFIAIQLSIYKSEIFLSLYFFVAFAISLHPLNLSKAILILFLALISPIIAIPFSIFVAFLLSSVVKKKIRIARPSSKGFNQKKFSIKCELQSLLKFPSLVWEIVLQVIFYFIIASISMSDLRFLSLLLIYNSLSTINTSSFSREGRMYDFFRSLPINYRTRYLPKIATYLLLTLPFVCLCIFVVGVKLQSYIVLFSLFPLTLNLINITIIGLIRGSVCPKVDWIRQQDALQLNYRALLLCVLITTVTSIILFFNPFCKNWVCNILISSIFNIFVLIRCSSKLKP